MSLAGDNTFTGPLVVNNGAVLLTNRLGSTTSMKVWNWSGNLVVGGGTDQLFFGNNASALTPDQISRIEFFSGSGTGSLGFGTLLSNGELVPVPEPSALLAAGGLFLISLVRDGRRPKKS